MKRLTPLILSVPLLLVGCSNEESGNAATTEPTTQTTDPDAPGYSNVLGSSGETITAGNITITVNDVNEKTAIEVMESPHPEADTHTETAPDGHKYIEVATTVENSSGRPWDLTCSQPISASIADEQGNIHLPMRNTYEVPGNPECNTMLNPGSSADMIWRFEMADNANPEFFGFADTDINYETPHFIEVSAA